MTKIYGYGIFKNSKPFACLSSDDSVNWSGLATPEQLQRTANALNMTVTQNCSVALSAFINHMQQCFQQNAIGRAVITSSLGVLNTNATEGEVQRFTAELCSHQYDHIGKKVEVMMGIFAAVIAFLFLSYMLIRVFTNSGSGCRLFSKVGDSARLGKYSHVAADNENANHESEFTL